MTIGGGDMKRIDSIGILMHSSVIPGRNAYFFFKRSDEVLRISVV
jgi:hypothetical protein